MTGVLIRQNFGHRDPDTQGEHCVGAEAETRFASASPGMPRVPGNHRTLGERPGTDSSAEPPEELTLPTP